MAAVELEHLTKIFDNGVRAVSDLSLSIRAGELLVLVGASGSGKTTVLRLLAGLEQPTTGKVFQAGREITQLPPWLRDVALVFQQPALYPHLNVAANLRFSVEQRQAPPHWFGVGCNPAAGARVAGSSKIPEPACRGSGPASCR